MRVASILFIFVVLIQVFMPCPDEMVGLQASSSIEKNLVSSEHEHKETDKCSPFCQCGCCATISIVKIYNGFPLILKVYASAYTPYVQSEYPDRSFSIWQPPKLVA